MDLPFIRFKPMKNKNAFSLVEVTLALGIISFGLVAVMGLMPVGLTTMRQAMDASIEEQIVQKIAGEVLLTPFSQLSDSIIGKSYYFDDQGIAVATANNARFWVAVQEVATTYPGSSAAPDKTPVTDSMRMLQVKIVVASNLKATTKSADCYRLLVENTGT